MSIDRLQTLLDQDLKIEPIQLLDLQGELSQIGQYFHSHLCYKLCIRSRYRPSITDICPVWLDAKPKLFLTVAVNVPSGFITISTLCPAAWFAKVPSNCCSNGAGFGAGPVVGDCSTSISGTVWSADRSHKMPPGHENPQFWKVPIPAFVAVMVLAVASTAVIVSVEIA